MSNFDKMSIIKKSTNKKQEQTQVKPNIDLSFDGNDCNKLTCSCCVKINMFDPNFQEKWEEFVERSNKIASDNEL